MAKEYVFVVRSGPVAGQEDAYNDWYTNIHLPDVLAVPGFVSAQRFRLTDPSAPDAPSQPYLALYTMRTDDPDRLLARLGELVESGEMVMSEAFNQEIVMTTLYEAITPLVKPV